MKTTLRVLTAIAAIILLATPAICDPVTFPTTGLDARSLGRGGTVIASPPGASSIFGNPATLIPSGTFGLGGDFVNDRNSEGSWSASIVDTSSSIRGAFSYFWEPEFADFEKDMWGVAFAQDLTGSIVIGESFHRGTYEPELLPGTDEILWAIDIGVLFYLGDAVSLGYVSHNMFDDSDVLEPFNGFGVGIHLPWTMQLTADYEENPLFDKEYDLRAGLEFTPMSSISCRFGIQELHNGPSLYTAGISYMDANGTIDAAILYDNDNKQTQRVVLGLTMGM